MTTVVFHPATDVPRWSNRFSPAAAPAREGMCAVSRAELTIIARRSPRRLSAAGVPVAVLWPAALGLRKVRIRQPARGLPRSGLGYYG